MRRHIGILMFFTISLSFPLMAYGHGGDTTKIHTCVNKSSGEIKVVGASESCGNNEDALDWAITPVQAAPEGCPPDSVRSGTICIDKYEASVWQTTNDAVIQKIKDGTVTLADLQAAGAVQRGASSDDYDSGGCPDTGNGCTNLYAVSIPGVTPSRFLSWFQAVASARNAGKRLPTNQEWQAAALGTPDGSPCAVSGSGPAPTGTAGCNSDVGAFDMVGNVWEWVAEWVPLSPTCASWEFSDDFMCLAGADTTAGPGALIRGGNFLSGTSAGVFAVSGGASASNGGISHFGFRAAR